MNLGLCCMCKSIPQGSFKTMTKTQFNKLLSKDQNSAITELKNRTLTNLSNTLHILKWCVQTNIKVYRFSSELIPLATLQTIWNWSDDKDVLLYCNIIKNFIAENNIRNSTHPDQYVVLTNWKDDNIFQNSLKDLEYHNALCNLLGCETILLHVGGVYGDKPKAVETFIANFNRLPEQIKSRLYLENDDKSYNVEEVLNICKMINIPMVVDFHHDRCNTSNCNITYYIDDIIATWKGKKPKCHISSGKTNSFDRSHADYINSSDYLEVIELTKDKFDIMVEAKEKDLAIMRLTSNKII